MFSTMINQATLRSYLDLPEQVRVTKKKEKVAPKREPNRTDKADALYLKTLKSGPMTTKQIHESTGKALCTVQRQMPKMVNRGLVVEVKRIKNKANPAILCGLK